MRREAPRANALLSDAFDLELSAFYQEPVEVREQRMLAAELANSQERRQPGVMSSMQKRKAELRDVKRTQYSRPDPARIARKPAEQNRAVALSKPANREHLQADQPSRQSRKENVRERCKERPDNNKGRGIGRKFVPWCDRKR